ncbi:Ubiquitin-conjugating enzyme E2 J2 [Gracilariopsis chorda]|uniref:E2 ubiquitin-conjugating enzyme n=1 Tax=Gracilariopsis chorda TaxID=448386 RepID=A0A2V3IUZ5_9FLOR|nr:Ubiquitin-conjugating enzyme E2 J2 [Gracilariopsis chorda]|eukprot:PXF45909.1 Ubiquitin-conjugating enzyme E2 J2 [Gracilariopsis chorda]
MTSKTSTHRLRKEFRNISREPPPHITARPLPSNILKWYFVLEGPTNTPYEGGIFMGRLQFPEQYPYKPPAVYMCTPQGRFKCNQKLCLSMSDFHPETWNPLWSVSAVLTGLLSFMLGNEDTVGSIQTTTSQKRLLARDSHRYNRSDKIFRELFPEFVRNVTHPAPSHLALAKRHQTADNQSTRKPRRTEQERESLLSLIAWLFVFVALIFGVLRLITGST